LLGSLFIFFLMGFLFESLLLPLSVMPSIPLAMVGVWWFLWLTGENLDPLAIVGVLLLLGVVVNNAIVLIDFINIARKRGLSRADAVVQAGAQRFRPIFMTALTTVGGMLPLAFAQAPAEGIPYNAFGKTLVGGMTTATILTLVIVPVSYTIFDDFRQFAMRWTGLILRRPTRGVAAAGKAANEDVVDETAV
jgi:HAE1 family hydrophobic/amphiphilic exporter-1